VVSALRTRGRRECERVADTPKSANESLIVNRLVVGVLEVSRYRQLWTL
jgi:hypothetical protein